jgi:hypothetical protein
MCWQPDFSLMETVYCLETEILNHYVPQGWQPYFNSEIMVLVLKKKTMLGQMDYEHIPLQ